MVKTAIPGMEVKRISDGRISDGLNYVHLGAAFGSMSPKEKYFLPRLFEIMKELGLKSIFSPRTNFTNAVPDVTANVGKVGKWKSFQKWENFQKGRLVISRTVDFADGVTVPKKKGIGLVIANADCSLVVMESEKTFTLLHAGLRCICRDDGSMSIIDVGFRHYHRDYNPLLKIWVGGGIGPCCYGSADNNLILKLSRRYGYYATNYFNGETTKVPYGPRKGQEAINLLGIIDCQISECLTAFYWPGADKRPRSVYDRTCTSCFGLKVKNGPGFGKFFSHVRDTENTGARNLFLMFPK